MQIKVDLYMPGQKGELPHCLLQLSLVRSFLENIPWDSLRQASTNHLSLIK